MGENENVVVGVSPIANNELGRQVSSARERTAKDFRTQAAKLEAEAEKLVPTGIRSRGSDRGLGDVLEDTEKAVLKAITTGRAIPEELERKWMHLLALGQADPKERFAAVAKALVLREKMEGTKAWSVADVPVGVLAKIAELELRGIVPYAPGME